jgi:hypothetical protein
MKAMLRKGSNTPSSVMEIPGSAAVSGEVVARARVASGMSFAGIILLFLPSVAAHANSSAGERDPAGQGESSAKLQPYVHCDGFAGGIRGVTLDRRPQTAERWREVNFGGRIQRVSVIDGYRVMYSYVRTYAFANLKAERSDRSRYIEDKEIVTSNLAEMARADDSLDLVAFPYQGFSVQMLTKRKLAGRTLGMGQILADEDWVIVTIYFLNQVPENRSFQTFEEFISLRDAFIRGYIECVARKRPASEASR